MTPTARLCDDPDCIRPAHSRGHYCAGHAKRKERGQVAGPLRERRTLFGRVLQLAIDLVDADADDDLAYGRAKDALEHALRDYARHLVQQKAGQARAAALTPARRREIAQTAATVRWMLAGKHRPAGKRRAVAGG